MSSGEFFLLSGHGFTRPTGALVFASSHGLISAWPSTKEKPAAPLWVEAGTSVQVAVAPPCIVTEKKSSLMLSGHSSRSTHVLAGPGLMQSLVFSNLRQPGLFFPL
ncbi:MAG TPA: hypothetical protein VJT54_10550, partial [Verrucomicrobiae bacterium]|nr:hypothetical protein [Verrucomicrobiae bacterium]